MLLSDRSPDAQVALKMETSNCLVARMYHVTSYQLNSKHVFINQHLLSTCGPHLLYCKINEFSQANHNIYIYNKPMTPCYLAPMEFSVIKRL